jgi:hypothetical protein
MRKTDHLISWLQFFAEAEIADRHHGRVVHQASENSLTQRLMLKQIDLIKKALDQAPFFEICELFRRSLD